MDTIAVIDFGSQYAHLIANRLRRLGVYSEILLPEFSSVLKNFSRFKGIILSGGPQSVYEAGAPTVNKSIFNLGIPIFGLCYGHQLIANILGGKVESGQTKEYGFAKLAVLKKIGIFEGIRDHTQVWMSHGDTVAALPPNFLTLGKTEDCPIAAMACPVKKIFSTQFHVEVTHTPEGMKMLENFVKLCRAKRTWSIEAFLKQKMEQIKKILDQKKVFLLVSGGVDSTVAYALLSQAIGTDRVYGLFVDTGLLRKAEPQQIAAMLKKIGIKNFHVAKAKQKFLNALRSVLNPEKKRNIIGELFLHIQAEVVRRLRLNPNHWVLGQGTIYPDTIESAGTKHADRIKTHHNRVPEILELIKKGKVIEPLAELYKDEVRELGAKLALPDELVWKHPFPGPGLAVRILCAEKEQYPEDVQGAEETIRKYLAPYGLFGKILPVQSVGVQGDSRTYRNPLAIWGHYYSFDQLEQIATSLTNRCVAINRVLMLLYPKSLENISLIPSFITEKRISLLQDLDDIVMKFIKQRKIGREMWQFPTILLPLTINKMPGESVILRPVSSEEAMTAQFYKMDENLLKQLVQKLHKRASAVFYDITNKPPGTIEWE